MTLTPQHPCRPSHGRRSLRRRVFLCALLPLTLVGGLRAAPPSLPDSTQANLDPDEDGLTNRFEALRGSKPDNKDSDGDGVEDLEDAVPYDSNLSHLFTPGPGMAGYAVVDLGTGSLKRVSESGEYVLVELADESYEVRKIFGGADSAREITVPEDEDLLPVTLANDGSILSVEGSLPYAYQWQTVRDGSGGITVIDSGSRSFTLIKHTFTGGSTPQTIDPPDFGGIPGVPWEYTGYTAREVKQETWKSFDRHRPGGEILFSERKSASAYADHEPYSGSFYVGPEGAILEHGLDSDFYNWDHNYYDIEFDTREELRTHIYETAHHHLEKTRTISRGEKSVAPALLYDQYTGTTADYYVYNYGDNTYKVNGNTIWIDSGSGGQGSRDGVNLPNSYYDLDVDVPDPASFSTLLQRLNSKDTNPDAVGYREFEDDPSELRLWVPQDGSQQYQEVPLYANSDDYPDQPIEPGSIRGFNSDRWVLYGPFNEPLLLWANGYSIDLNSWANNLQPDLWSDFAITDLRDNGFLYGTATKDGGNKHTVLLLKVDVEWESQDEANPIKEFEVPASYAEYTSQDLSWLEGKRYFPGAASPDGDSYRNTLNVRVSVPGYANGTVKLRAFDVDDPTPIDGVDDDSGDSLGNDNFDGFFGFFSGTVTTGSVVEHTTGAKSIVLELNNNGEAVVEFVSGFYPGDNYRIAAELVIDGQTSTIEDLQVDTEGGSYVTADNDPVPQLAMGTVGDMLTIWRKLHIEVDSMEAGPPATGSESNTVTGTITEYLSDTPFPGRSSLTLDSTLPDEEDRFEFGKITISGEGTFQVRSNSDNWISDDTVGIKGTPGAEIVGKSFTLVDDDDFYLAEAGLGAPLPQDGQSASYIEAIKPKYAPAFIEVENANALGLNPNMRIPFKLNGAVITVGNFSHFDYAKDLDDSNFFWAHTLVFGYQGLAEINRLDDGGDGDPQSDFFLLGGTPEVGLLDNRSMGFSVIFMETIRDRELGGELAEVFLDDPVIMDGYRTRFFGRLFGTIAHEIAHSPGLQNEGADHSEGDLMGDGGATIDVDFSGTSISRFRRVSGWAR